MAGAAGDPGGEDARGERGGWVRFGEGEAGGHFCCSELLLVVLFETVPENENWAEEALIIPWADALQTFKCLVDFLRRFFTHLDKLEV